MAQFGKADVGLIKATAGAEQSQFVDDNLTIGSLVGGMVAGLEKKAGIRAGVEAGIQKDIDDKFPTISANLPDQFTENLLEFVPGQKTEYAGAGGGIFGKSNQAKTLANTTDYYTGLESLVGNIKANAAFTGDYGAGHNAQTIIQDKQIQAGNYSVYTARDKTGKPMPMIAIPNRVEANASTFTYEDDGSGTGNVQQLLDFQNENPSTTGYFSPNQQTAIDNYNKANKNYTDWKADKSKHTLADGTPNPEYFQLISEVRSKEGNLDNARKESEIFTSNTISLKGDAAHLEIGNSGTYAAAYEGQIKDYKGIDLQNALFTDASDDGINGNSYAEFFINQKADPKKHPNMYMKANGKPIEFNYEEDGQEKGVTYSSEAGSDFQNLPDAVQEKLLKMYVTGEDTKGNFNPDANSKFLKTGYANFMGGVTKDGAEMQQAKHFSSKGMYFNNGDGNPVNPNDISNNRQKIAYSNHKFNAAFPESLLGGDNLGWNYPHAPHPIRKALIAEFPDAGLVFPSAGIIEVDGIDTPFDFTGNNKKQEMQRLREHLSENSNFSDRENSLQKSMSKDVSGNDWKSMRRKKSEYHGYQPVTNYLAFEAIDGATVEGPLTVVAFNPSQNNEDGTGGLYEVTDSNGKTHMVEEETLYPNGI